MYINMKPRQNKSRNLIENSGSGFFVILTKKQSNKYSKKSLKLARQYDKMEQTNVRKGRRTYAD